MSPPEMPRLRGIKAECGECCPENPGTPDRPQKNGAYSAYPEMYEEASGHGLRSGVTLPIHGANGELGMLCFASDIKPDHKFSIDIIHNIPELACLRDFISETSLQFRYASNRENQPIPLTPRELECLKWSVTGKSSWDIGQILNCSEAVVNFHFKNIRSKFGTSTRRQALVKAISLGIISPS